ncbi:MAG: hypothetical protein ACYDIE_13825 [Candidatus Krumholzibacteriia bacterium]
MAPDSAGAPGQWPRKLRLTISALGLLGLAGTLAPLLTAARAPAWVAPVVANAVAAPLRADLPDSTFARLHREYVAEIDFAANGFARALGAMHRHPDRWLALPLFLVAAAAPWRRRRPRPAPSGGGAVPPASLPGGEATRGALLGLIPLQLLFHGTSIQPLLGAWVDLLGNLTRSLLMIQIQAYSYFVPETIRAVALFFAEESPRLEAQLQRQLWLLRGMDLLLAAGEAFRTVSRDPRRHRPRRLRRRARPAAPTG